MKNNNQLVQLLFKYPDKVCLYVEIDGKIKHFMQKNKFLVPRYISFSKLSQYIRLYLEISSRDSLFFYINNSIIPNMGQSIDYYYERYKGEDMMLHIKVLKEETFGQLFKKKNSCYN
jgi:hypothetical protein